MKFVHCVLNSLDSNMAETRSTESKGKYWTKL